jgi:hypothetical protein
LNGFKQPATCWRALTAAGVNNSSSKVKINTCCSQMPLCVTCCCGAKGLLVVNVVEVCGTVLAPFGIARACVLRFAVCAVVCSRGFGTVPATRGCAIIAACAKSSSSKVNTKH